MQQEIPKKCTYCSWWQLLKDETKLSSMPVLYTVKQKYEPLPHCAKYSVMNLQPMKRHNRKSESQRVPKQTFSFHFRIRPIIIIIIIMMIIIIILIIMIIKLSFSNSAFPRKCRHSYGLTQSPLSLSESLQVPVTGWKVIFNISNYWRKLFQHACALPQPSWSAIPSMVLLK